MTLPTLAGLKVRLCPKSAADARSDYRWQKDAELMALNGNEPLRESFLDYLTLSAADYGTANGMEMFAIRTLSENRHIGNCALYQLDHAAGEAQLGITLGERDCWGHGYGHDAMMTMVNYALESLGLVRLHLKTLENNDRARRCFEKCGFSPYGKLLHEGHQYILMELRAASMPSPAEDQAPGKMLS
ncbi:MAG: GNAT family N-acetyltransferase [Dehalococcoidia bacterium]|nr:GNAT family N-acetyltransferase [Dehalococcoidia bacterium]